MNSSHDYGHGGELVTMFKPYMLHLSVRSCCMRLANLSAIFSEPHPLHYAQRGTRAVELPRAGRGWGAGTEAQCQQPAGDGKERGLGVAVRGVRCTTLSGQEGFVQGTRRANALCAHAKGPPLVSLHPESIGALIPVAPRACSRARLTRDAVPRAVRGSVPGGGGGGGREREREQETGSGVRALGFNPRRVPTRERQGGGARALLPRGPAPSRPGPGARVSLASVVSSRRARPAEALPLPGFARGHARRPPPPPRRRHSVSGSGSGSSSSSSSRSGGRSSSSIIMIAIVVVVGVVVVGALRRAASRRAPTPPPPPDHPSRAAPCSSNAAKGAQARQAARRWGPLRRNRPHLGEPRASFLPPGASGGGPARPGPGGSGSGALPVCWLPWRHRATREGRGGAGTTREGVSCRSRGFRGRGVLKISLSFPCAPWACPVSVLTQPARAAASVGAPPRLQLRSGRGRAVSPALAGLRGRFRCAPT
eukprot:scaffold1978_cov381-Prasinococcus_capsulatus_cf.AAC.11